MAESGGCQRRCTALAIFDVGILADEQHGTLLVVVGFTRNEAQASRMSGDGSA